jgi:Flp pilus assembly protein CpaB
LTVGDAIAANDLALKPVPERFVEERHVLARDRESLLGARSAVALPVGAALLWTDVDTAPEGRTLASLVRPGMRAVSLRASEVGFDGMLRPGDRVDVLFVESEAPQRGARLLVQSALVLNVGDDLGGAGMRDERKRQQATRIALSVTPSDAQAVAVARGRGSLSLALRHPTDTSAVAAAQLNAESASDGRGLLAKEVRHAH